MRNPFHLLPKAVDLGKFLKKEHTVDSHKIHALGALQRKNGPIYQGTVSKAVVQRRRAKNKAARKARRAQRARAH